MISESVWVNISTRSRMTGGEASAARPNITAKTTRDSIDPSAAAFTGLAGINVLNHPLRLASPVGRGTVAAVDRSKAVVAASIFRPLYIAGASSNAANTQTDSRPMNHAPVASPRRPSARPLRAPATEPISSGRINGMTVMRIALTHIVPTTSHSSTKPLTPGFPGHCRSIQPVVSPSTRLAITAKGSTSTPARLLADRAPPESSLSSAVAIPPPLEPVPSDHSSVEPVLVAGDRGGKSTVDIANASEGDGK